MTAWDLVAFIPVAVVLALWLATSRRTREVHVHIGEVIGSDLREAGKQLAEEVRKAMDKS